MSWPRLFTVLRFDLAESLKRPLVWIWLFLILIAAMLMATGALGIHSGEDVAGGL